MARWVLLRVEDDTEAERLIRDSVDYPDSPLLTPCQENQVCATVEDWWATDPRGNAEEGAHV